MDLTYLAPIKQQLSERRERLLDTNKYLPKSEQLFDLLKQVDAALERIDNGSYGICEVCKAMIEEEILKDNPLITVCLSDLNSHQQKALELDLEFASKIQRNMLPQNNMNVEGWNVSYHYKPAGPVSGDFCDMIKLADNSFLFVLGDVSGKGVAASLMMSHLNALIHSLLSFGLTTQEIMQKANNLFCKSTMNTNYATMVLGKANFNGEVEICNAGHNAPLLLSKGEIKSINATGIPVGLFCDINYTVEKYLLTEGDSLLLYTDGLTESIANGIEYGEKRVKEFLINNRDLSAEHLIEKLIIDNKEYINNSLPVDDLTLLMVKKK
jgi:phosphoserine phosphatase RsbU/P